MHKLKWRAGGVQNSRGRACSLNATVKKKNGDELTLTAMSCPCSYPHLLSYSLSWLQIGGISSAMFARPPPHPAQSTGSLEWYKIPCKSVSDLKRLINTPHNLSLLSELLFFFFGCKPATEKGSGINLIIPIIMLVNNRCTGGKKLLGLHSKGEEQTLDFSLYLNRGTWFFSSFFSWVW